MRVASVASLVSLVWFVAAQGNLVERDGTSLCALFMTSDNTGLYAFGEIDQNLGIFSPLVLLPELDSYGAAISTGAEQGVYYTVSGNVSMQEMYLQVHVDERAAEWRQIILPEEFSFLSLFGVGDLTLDVSSGDPSVMSLILGYREDGARFAFLAHLDDQSGAATFYYNLTESYRTWEYLYTGVVSWHADTGMYYLAVVLGDQYTTTLLGFDTTTQSSEPVVSVPFKEEGDFMSLEHSAALGGLVALVSDLDNTAAALWLLNVTDVADPFWQVLYQYPPHTLSPSTHNNMVLDANGLTAFSVFYDRHEPIANQIVSVVDLMKGEEVNRIAVVGSQAGQSIADIAICPSPPR